MKKTLTDIKKEVNVRIANNVNMLLLDGKKYSQNGFREFCKQHGVVVNQGNLSKCLSDPEHNNINPMLLYYFSQYFQISMEELMWKELSNPNRVTHLLRTTNESKEENLVFDVSKPCFEHYLGEYECYFYPTISGEKKLLCGKMRIYRDCNNWCCRVEITINTNTNKEGTEQPFYKQYSGIMFLSRELQVCYCIVESGKMGECNFISFRNVRRPNNMQYLGGMAAVLTVSAGGDNVPTMHRMIISRNPVSADKLEHLKANLLLNATKILIPTQKLESIMEEMQLAENVRERIRVGGEKDSYCEISERILRDIDKTKLNNVETTEFIARIRSVSYALRYNKISRKLDEHILKLLTKD